MAFLLANMFNGTEEVDAAGDWPLVRMFTSAKIKSPVALREQPHVEEQWAVSSPAAVDMHHNGSAAQDDDWLYMSAVCWLYGKHIHEATGHPVGLVNTNWGGSACPRSAQQPPRGRANPLRRSACRVLDAARGA